MYFNLALKNVKKCSRDYNIYFVTLVFAVCIFYIFNMILYKGIMNGLPLIVQRGLENEFLYYISATSIIGSFIFGLLIICANSYIIKKRKKEFGIYMSLGMGKINISLLLFYETLIIGSVSLVSGILIGVMLSQAMEAINAKLMNVTLSKYSFIFSEKALIKTLSYFVMMFLLVEMFNFFSLLNSNIIYLLSPLKESEKLKVENIYINLFMFLASITAMGTGYSLLIKSGISSMGASFFTSAILCSIGTLLLFLSFPVLIIKVVKANKHFYFKGLNIFLLRQLSKRSISNVISMSVFCIMLSFAICILSAGISQRSMLQREVEFVTPFDVSMSIRTTGDKSVSSVLKGIGLNINDLSCRYIEFYEYDTPLTIKSLMKDSDLGYIKEYYQQSLDIQIKAIGISDYNKIMNMQRLKKINLNSGEALIITNNKAYKSFLAGYAKKNFFIKLRNENFNFETDAVKFQSLETTASPTDDIILVLPDKAVKTLSCKRSVLNMNYVGNKTEIENKIINEYEARYKIHAIGKEQITSYTKLLSSQINIGISTIMFYICIFVGLIMIIAGTVIMALQQLSQAVENVKRYNILKKMGTDGGMLNRSLFLQILIYFTMPLLVVATHSAVGMMVIEREFSTYENLRILPSVFFALAAVILVLVVYFIITWKAYNNIIHRQKEY